MIDEIKKGTTGELPHRLQIREIKAESKFNQALSLVVIDSIVPPATIAAVLTAEGGLRNASES